MTVYSQDPAQQKLQMEQLAADVLAADNYTVDYTVTTVWQLSLPTIFSLGYYGLVDAAGDPATRIFWYDGKYMRGEFGTLKDYLLPLTTSSKQIPGNVQTINKVLWLNRLRYLISGSFFTATAGVYETRTKSVWIDNDTDTITSLTTAAEEVVTLNRAANKVVTVSATNILRIGDYPTIFGPVAPTTSTTIDVGVNRPVVAVMDDLGDIYFRDSTNPNNVQRRTAAGVVSTIVTGFTDLAEIRWSQSNNVLILIKHVAPVATSSAYKVAVTGGTPTLLVAAGDYAAGHLSNQQYLGVEIQDGFLYVPVPGSKYIMRRRKYNIDTGTYVEEDYDFRQAKAVYEEASRQAQEIIENAQGAYTQKRAYWGAEYFAYPFTRLLDSQRDTRDYADQDTASLICYETGPLSALPGAQQGVAWAILPDNGVSGKVYPRSELIDPRGDVFTVKEHVFDTAVKELTLDWSDVNLQDFDSFDILFDNGLTTATETIRVQLNGSTGAVYEHTFYRAVVGTISNAAALGQTFWELYGVNTTTFLGGKYILRFVDHKASAVVNAIIEGVTATALTTGTVNSILGMGKWTNPGPGSRITSVRIFLSGSTAFFAANTKIQVIAYRTKGTY
jgi:hypothetical protein